MRLNIKITKGFRHRTAASFHKRLSQMNKAVRRMDIAIDHNQREAIYESLSDMAKCVEAFSQDIWRRKFPIHPREKRKCLGWMDAYA